LQTDLLKLTLLFLPDDPLFMDCPTFIVLGSPEDAQIAHALSDGIQNSLSEEINHSGKKKSFYFTLYIKPWSPFSLLVHCTFPLGILLPVIPVPGVTGSQAHTLPRNCFILRTKGPPTRGAILEIEQLQSKK
jgi:hypothetical protein